jgi:copper homeostasis protein CutC
MIKIQEMSVTYHCGIDMECNDVEELEEIRQRIAEKFLMHGTGEKAIRIDFTIQTMNFDQIKYPKNKKRK